MTVQEVGSPRKRSEDARLITGRTRWTDNMTLAGTLHVAFLRSPISHAHITNVDTSRAKQSPGVVAVASGQDLADEQGSLPCAWVVTEDMKHPDHPPMAVTEVRYVGEPVACVVARDKAAAVDALEEIDVDYEPLSAVVDMESALAEGADLVHDDLGTNKSYTWVFENGDLDAAMRTHRSSLSAATSSRGSSPRRWSRGRCCACRRGTSSRCTRPRKSRTSCG